MTNLRQITNKQILSLTIIGEARGEPIESQVAVGCVIRNRLNYNPYKYLSYHDVCLERLQFSCWNENDPNRPLLLRLADRMSNDELINDLYLRQCMFVAIGIVDYLILDNTNRAQYYMTTELFQQKTVKWARGAKNIKEFGRQTYFTV